MAEQEKWDPVNEAIDGGVAASGEEAQEGEVYFKEAEEAAEDVEDEDDDVDEREREPAMARAVIAQEQIEITRRANLRELAPKPAAPPNAGRLAQPLRWVGAEEADDQMTYLQMDAARILTPQSFQRPMARRRKGASWTTATPQPDVREPAERKRRRSASSEIAEDVSSQKRRERQLAPHPKRRKGVTTEILSTPEHRASVGGGAAHETPPASTPKPLPNPEAAARATRTPPRTPTPTRRQYDGNGELPHAQPVRAAGGTKPRGKRRSSATPLPGSPARKLERYLQSLQERYGVEQRVCVNAIQMCMGNRALCEEVVRARAAGRPVPSRAGIWSEEDDRLIRDPDPAQTARVTAKHGGGERGNGAAAVLARLRFLLHLAG